MEEEDIYSSPWDNFASVIADNLGVDPQHIHPQHSFQEMGGTSLNLVSTVLKLQQSGIPITLEQFLTAGSIEQVLLQASLPTLQPKFLLKPLSQVSHSDQRAAQELLAQSFLHKTELFTLCGNMTLADFLNAYSSWWHIFQEYSFVIVDQADKLRAAVLAADQLVIDEAQPDESFHPHLCAIFQMLKEVTAITQQQLNPLGKPRQILSKFMMGASLENTAEENVIAFTMMEKELMEVAKRDGFSATMAENISPLTQQLSEYLGCKRYLTVYLRNWTDPSGARPFANCSEDYSVTVDVYHV
ncbi:hypothetical protein RvY_06663 [Ramazzottius varieornatus]|uniref:Carrier domain-containing protein n=1 Tax=Ramazzottius varieornatus TaxID=947166 RepID=A0A1D1UZC4_RAMVA|nr:hypothetical protein RvY_06663 [Ramazzottius varieornatus]